MMQKLKSFLQENGLFLLFSIGLLAFYLTGIADIPFHPDESSILYQSKDFEAWVTQPGTLFWEPGTPMVEYRAFNPALTKYWQGVSYSLFGFRSADVNNDWDWSEDWAANLEAGNYPDSHLLVIARSAMAIASWLGVIAFYFATKAFTNKNIAAVAAIFFSLDALLLLHGRRAMSEGLLVLGLTLSLLIFMRASNRSWLVGLAVGLALNAKHSLALLIPVGLLAVLWDPDTGFYTWRTMLKKTAVYFTVLAGLTYFLNPIIWPHPIQGSIKMAGIASRQGWVELQYETLRQFDLINIALDSPVKRVAGVLGHLYFVPVQFHEFGNYVPQTGPQEEAYSDLLIHNLWHYVGVGTIWLAINLTAIGFFLRNLYIKGVKGQRPLVILLVSYSISLGAILWTMYLPWQRYVIPLVPFTYAWFAVFAHQIFMLKSKHFAK